MGGKKTPGRSFPRRGRGEETLNPPCSLRRREESWVPGGARAAVRAKPPARAFGRGSRGGPGPVVAGRDPGAHLQRATVPTLLRRPSEEPVGAAGSLWRRGGAGPSGRPAGDRAQTKAQAPVGEARADNLGRPARRRETLGGKRGDNRVDRGRAARYSQ